MFRRRRTLIFKLPAFVNVSMSCVCHVNVMCEVAIAPANGGGKYPYEACMSKKVQNHWKTIYGFRCFKSHMFSGKLS